MSFDLLNMGFQDFGEKYLLLSLIGLLILLPYFHKSKLWNDFSNYEKAPISFVCLIITFFGIVYPLSRIYILIISFFYGFDSFSFNDNDLMKVYVAIYVILFVGICYIRFLSPKPLFDNCTCVKKIFLGYYVFFILLILFSIDFCLIVFLSGYREYFTIVFSNLLISTVLIMLFSIVHLAVHKNSITCIYSHIEENIALFRTKFQPKKQMIVLVLLILLPCLVGYVLFSYSVVETEQEFYAIYIDELPVFDPPNYISAERESIKHYTIKPSIALKWVKITPDLHLKKAYKKIDGKYYYYDINDNNYFIVNESSKTNVTAIVTEKINLSTELMISDKVLPNYDNDTEFFQITLKNNITYIIETDFIELHIDSNYEPIQLTKNHIRTYGQYSSTWNKNGSDFNNQIFTKGNSLYLRCPPLYQNNSVEFYAILKKIDHNQ